MTKEELITEAREYLAQHSEYSEVFGETFVAVDTLTAMVDFAESREKRIAELEEKLANADYQLEGRDNEIAELKNVVLDLLDNSDESTRLKALNCIYKQKEIKEK